MPMYVATSYTYLALVYNRLGEYNQAKHLHEKALMIWKRIFGEDHAHLASPKCNLAPVLKILGVPRLPPEGSLGKRGTVPKIWRAALIF